MSQITSQPSNLLDRGLNSLCQDLVMPTIRVAYRASATLSTSVTYVFSKSLAQSVENAFYDPISTSKILDLSRGVERFTDYFASRKPSDSPWIFHYIDRSFCSMNQHLHSYTVRINDLLVVPENIKRFIAKFS